VFSIVIPLFNKEPHVARALRSVFDQTESSWEVIVVDDGSTDGGASVVRSYDDPRIRYLYQENQGPSEARNRGIEEARFPWVAFLDADDEWIPGHLSALKRLIHRFPQAAICAQSYVIRHGHLEHQPRLHRIPRKPRDLLIPNYFASAKPGSLPVWTSTVAIPRAVLIKIGGFPRGVRRGEDLECWALAALEGPVAFSHEVGAIYFKDTVNRHNLVPRTLNRRLGLEVAIEEGRVPGPLLRGARLYVQRHYVRRYEALLKSGSLTEAKEVRKLIGRPLSWDTGWKTAFLDVRTMLPEGQIGRIKFWEKRR